MSACDNCLREEAVLWRVGDRFLCHGCWDDSAAELKTITEELTEELIKEFGRKNLLRVLRRFDSKIRVY